MESIILLCVGGLNLHISPAPGFVGNEAYTRVLGQIPRIIIGGWIAVWAGAIANDYVLAKMKVWTGGKHLWTRTIGSTIVGEFVNTVLFYVIALYAILPNNLLVTSILSGWFLKVAIETVLTPWTYWVVNKLKRAEQEDYYDQNTNFNPFIVTDKRAE